MALTYGTTRAHMASALHLAARVGAQLYGGNDQYAALMAGGPVTFTREQVESLCPPNLRPPDVAEHESWVLTEASTWTPTI